MSPKYPIGIHWPDNAISVEWPAEWIEDAFSGDPDREEIAEQYNQGWYPVAVSPRQHRSPTGEIEAQFVLLRD